MTHRLVVGLLTMLCLAATSVAQTTYQTPPEELSRLVDVPVTPSVVVSPDQKRILFLERPGLASIEDLAAPELKLAGIRFNPTTNGPSRSQYYSDIKVRNIDGSGLFSIQGIPEEGLIRNVSWSPSGAYIAFTVTVEGGIELYTADMYSGSAELATKRKINAMYGSPYEWVPGGKSMLVKTIPTNRGLPPSRDAAPAGPVIQNNDGVAAPNRTYQDLLKSELDKTLFDHYGTSQLMMVTIGGKEYPIDQPAVILSARPSPNGEFILRERIHRPYSYLVPAYRFPRAIDVLDRTGGMVTKIADLELAENVPTGFGSVPEGVRSIGWRGNDPATLYWAEAMDGGDARAEVEHRDKVMMWASPFSGEPQVIAKLPLRFSGVQWGGKNTALVTENWWSTRKRRVYSLDLAKVGEQDVLFDYSTEDRYNDPGRPMTVTNANGYQELELGSNGRTIYLTGSGASAEGDRPFVRTMDLRTKKVREIFRSEAPYYEIPVGLIGTRRRTLMTRRESADEPPNFFLRDLRSGKLTAVTKFEHPYPDLAYIEKELITYKREDGVDLSAMLYLPTGYKPDIDGPLPTLMWAYPREFKDKASAGQVSGSPHRFKAISYWGALPYITRGYAVMDQTAMPVLGEDEKEPNDTFVEQLVMSAEAAINEGVRRGVIDADRVAIGGHSYGAFMTANLLAHSDLFRAGIARSGAYNRSLTPFGFQREERTFWEAPEIYFAMSPFMHAQKVNEPILLIHGQADNNSGTFPIQSERYYNALKGHGATARLVMLPLESHGYRARESIMHMLYETDSWLEKHVKNAPVRDKVELKSKETGEGGD